MKIRFNSFRKNWSTKLNHKKMYKAKKHWVVASLTLITIMGLGALSPDLAHATVTKLPTVQNASSASLESRAHQMTSRLASNLITSRRQSPNYPRQSSTNVKFRARTGQVLPARSDLGQQKQNHQYSARVTVKFGDQTLIHNSPWLLKGKHQVINANRFVCGDRYGDNFAIDPRSVTFRDGVNLHNGENATVYVDYAGMIGSSRWFLVPSDNKYYLDDHQKPLPSDDLFFDGGRLPAAKSKAGLISDYTTIPSSDIEMINFHHVTAPRSCSYLFANLPILSSVRGSLNTAKVNDMNDMFFNDADLTDVSTTSTWRTSDVQDMIHMFGYDNVREVDMHSWNTKNTASDMTSMFSDSDGSDANKSICDPVDALKIGPKTRIVSDGLYNNLASVSDPTPGWITTKNAKIRPISNAYSTPNPGPLPWLRPSSNVISRDEPSDPDKIRIWFLNPNGVPTYRHRRLGRRFRYRRRGRRRFRARLRYRRFRHRRYRRY